jgi:hypothetical protein
MPSDISSTAGPQSSEDYSGSSITVLRGLEAVRKRPGMYIGDTDDGSGLHHMAFEIIDNSMDEAQAGFASRVDVVLNGDGSVTVTDDGRGIPVDIHEEEGVSAAEVVLTRLHAGGKFNQNSYKVSGGLHGVGAAVVNALSEWMEVRIWREGVEHFIRFEHGDTVQPLRVVGPATHGNGTEVTFKPAASTFTQTEYQFPILERRLRELAFLNSGIRITLRDDRHVPAQEIDFKFDGGLRAFVEWLDKGKEPICKPPITLALKEGDGIRVELAMWWTSSPREVMLCFTNNIPSATAAPTRPASARPDPRGGQIRRGPRQEGKGRAGRRGHARGADLRAVGEGAGPQVLLADQGQAGLLRGAAGGADGRGRRAVPLVRDASEGTASWCSTRSCSAAVARKARSSRGRRWGARTRSTSRPCPASWPTARRRTRRRARSSSSRVTAPAARPSRAATAPTRPSCR